MRHLSVGQQDLVGLNGAPDVGLRVRAPSSGEYVCLALLLRKSKTETGEKAGQRPQMHDTAPQVTYSGPKKYLDMLTIQPLVNFNEVL